MGTAKCWGYNYYGQLGDGTNRESLTPVGSSGLVRRVPNRGQRAIKAVRSWGDGTAKVLGYNVYGILVMAPVRTDGYPHRCSTCQTRCNCGGCLELLCACSGRHAKCWGRNNGGWVLGDGTQEDRMTPVVGPGLSGAVEIASGDWHSCARLGDGTAKCWGQNEPGPGRRRPPLSSTGRPWRSGVYRSDDRLFRGVAQRI